MKKSEIDKLARLITEDPDVYLEEDEAFLTVTHTNIYGETRNLTVKEAWHGPPKRWQYTTVKPSYFIIVWADGTSGSLARAGLTEESIKKLEAIAKPNVEHVQAKRARRYLNIRKNRWREKIGIWNYMWQVYGRDCPNWWREDHIAEGNNCWRTEFPDIKYRVEQDSEYERLTGQEGRAFRGQHRGPGADLSRLPRGSEPHSFKSTYMTDYGKLSVGRDVETGEITFKLAGEETVAFHDPEEAEEYLRDEMGIEP